MNPSLKRYNVTAPVITVVEKIEKFLARFIAWPETNYGLPLALWILGTFMFTEFDAFPYLVITADTKRSGKTRLAELLSFVCSNPQNSAAHTASTLFRSIEADQPTIFFDEAETLSGEAASAQRAVLNVGYRKGQTVPRTVGGEVVQFRTYCPKVFILIGMVFDTLKDRSIIVHMKRGEPRERFTYEAVKAQGEMLRAECAKAVEENHSAIVDAYVNFEGLGFLTDRDEEIWSPLFILCGKIAPHRMNELKRIATDMSTEKLYDTKKYTKSAEAEQDAEKDEYRLRLLRDLSIVIDGAKAMHTTECIKRLIELPTGPWRKFRYINNRNPHLMKGGEGLSPSNMGDMLRQYGVTPQLVRVNGKVARGYKQAEVKKALADKTDLVKELK